MPRLRANVGKQSISYMGIDIWKDLPPNLKDSSVFAFSKQIKRYLLSEQQTKQFSLTLNTVTCFML